MGELIGLVAVVMIFGIPLLSIWTRHQRKVAEMQVDATAEHTAEKAAQYASHIQKLEDRVRVLERIVTDSGYQLTHEIERLREEGKVQ